MECKALVDPAILAGLIAELEGAPSAPWREKALVCYSQSVEDPGRKRLWVVPRDQRAGANPSLWIKEHQELFNELLDRNVVHTNVVFPGHLPRSAQRDWVTLSRRDEGGRAPAADPGRRGRIRKEVRSVSAASHLWVDRLRIFGSSGEIDDQGRRSKLQLWGGRYWKPDMEQVFIPPNLQVVHDSNEDLGREARVSLLAAKPSCLKLGLVVVYGQGGVGKTFFLSRVSERLSAAASGDLTSSLPVFLQLTGVLHRYALENWLSRNGFGMLTLAQIGCLLRYGVIVPLLDALDEVVKGEARQGSEEFLDHLLRVMSSDGTGRGVLACRDYYLTTDRALVRERVQGSACAELLIGPFDKKDTRRFLQARTHLEPDHASRWADALEREAAAIVGDEAELDVIRHPVVLDTLARYITELPAASRVTAADEFRLSRGDIFGEIVDELLEREREKLLPLWEETFAGRLDPDWMDPFAVGTQRTVLRELTLLVAKDGGAPSSDEFHRSEINHGLFLGTRNVPPSDSRRAALEALMEQILGRPEVAPTVPEEERSEIENRAISHLGEAYAGHILADTEPDRPADLAFALRHRFYFDYFLADALLNEIERALKTGRSSELLEWCLSHHVGGSFATCLDFLAWDPRVARQGVSRLREVFRSGQEIDDVLASYLASLSLAIFLRRQVPGQERALELLQFAADPTLEIMLMKEFLPSEISHFSLASCSFPNLTFDSIDMSDVNIESCDFEDLRVIGTPRTRITRCKFGDLECRSLTIQGNVVLSETELDIDGRLVVSEGAHVELYNCAMTERVLAAFEEAGQSGAEVLVRSPVVIEKRAPLVATQSPGRRFVNKLMSILRKEGHSDFAVYIYKLRDKTPGTDEQFSRALAVLRQRGCVETRDPMVFMTTEGAAEMYRPRLLGKVGYDSHDEYWEPIIEELDAVLAS